MRRNGLKLHQEMYRLDARRSFFTEKVVRNWNRLLRQVVESPSWEVFKEHVDVHLGIWFSDEHSGAALPIQLDHLSGLVQLK